VGGPGKATHSKISAVGGQTLVSDETTSPIKEGQNFIALSAVADKLLGIRPFHSFAKPLIL